MPIFKNGSHIEPLYRNKEYVCPECLQVFIKTSDEHCCVGHFNECCHYGETPINATVADGFKQLSDAFKYAKKHQLHDEIRTYRCILDAINDVLHLNGMLKEPYFMRSPIKNLLDIVDKLHSNNVRNSSRNASMCLHWYFYDKYFERPCFRYYASLMQERRNLQSSLINTEHEQWLKSLPKVMRVSAQLAQEQLKMDMKEKDDMREFNEDTISISNTDDNEQIIVSIEGYGKQITLTKNQVYSLVIFQRVDEPDEYDFPRYAAKLYANTIQEKLKEDDCRITNAAFSKLVRELKREIDDKFFSQPTDLISPAPLIILP